MALLAIATSLSIFMTAPWQLFLTWGLLVGIGSGAGAVGMAAAVANRWFTKRNGLAMGLLSSANAAGQLIFLPLLAMLAERYGWQAVAGAVTLTIVAMIPLLMILLPESPAAIGLGPYGSVTAPRLPVRAGNPFTVAFHGLSRAVRSGDFWLLALSFGVCGFSTNGLINTHLIAFCADRGISEIHGASFLAVIGVFRGRLRSQGADSRLRFGWARRCSMRRIMASLTMVSETSGSSSYSLASRRQRPSQPSVRSATQRRGRRTKPLVPARRLITTRVSPSRKQASRAASRS
jgi:MFS family permease